MKEQHIPESSAETQEIPTNNIIQENNQSEKENLLEEDTSFWQQFLKIHDIIKNKEEPKKEEPKKEEKKDEKKDGKAQEEEEYEDEEEEEDDEDKKDNKK